MRKGLGRAVLLLQNHDDAPYRAGILKAITQDLRYDRQVEDLRSRYAVDLMRATRRPEPYRNALLAALRRPDEGRSEDLMVEIAAILAEDGDPEGRQAVYDAYERHRSDDTWTGVQEIARLDGVSGLLRAVQGLDAVDWKEDAWYLSMVIEDTLEATRGKSETWDALNAGASGSERLTEALENVHSYRRESEQARESIGKRKPRPPASFEDLVAILDADDPRSRHVPRRWGMDAGDEDLRLAAAALLAETDRERRLALLRVFTSREFPIAPEPLISLAGSEDWETANCATLAMANIRHPAVRAYAVDAIRNPEHAAQAVDMLNRNFEEGDHALIEWLAEQPETNPDEEHWRGRAISRFSEAHPNERNARILTLAYAKQSCSFCRYFIVQALLELGTLPQAIRDECLYDCHMDTRFLAKHGTPPGD